ncbi:MAG: hypothetical protein K2J46_10770 [Muribaculaceae bacterium]|nr:hypothetical protein [Muribaculaceae bacterium]
MKKFLLFFLSGLFSLSAMADLNGDGYYRVQNALTKRYSYLFDDKGKIDYVATTADVQALQLFSGFLRASSDPSTIFYISNPNGSNYDIAGQGTSVHGFLKEYVKIMKGKNYDGGQSYYVYATNSTVSKYLGDLETDLNEEQGMSSADATKDKRLWYFNPVDAASEDSYFGIAPTLTAGGKYYHPLYAGFPFSAYSEGVKFYYISNVDSRHKVAVMKEIVGTVPAGKAVIVECSNPLATDNRLNVGISGSVANLDDNKLSGVYFDNDTYRAHYNRTPYDKETMRILKVVDGKLTFTVGDVDFLPRNQAYLQLTDRDQYPVADYTLVSEEEYNDIVAAVEVIPASALVDVYSLDGRLVKSGIAKTDVNSLGKGLYIIKAAGLSEKLILH